MRYVKLALFVAASPLLLLLYLLWWLVASIVNRIDPLEEEWPQHEAPNREAPVVPFIADRLNPDRGRSGRVSWRRG
jgi:hypothetical protein